MWVQSLGREDPLEEGMATHSSILARRILGTEEPGGLQSIGSQKSWTRLKQLNMDAHTHATTSFFSGRRVGEKLFWKYFLRCY